MKGTDSDMTANIEVKQYGIKVTSGSGTLWVLPVHANVIRIVCSKRDVLSSAKSLMVTAQDPFMDWHTEEDEQIFHVLTEKVEVAIDKATLSITYYTAGGEVILRESAKEARCLEEIDVVKAKFDKDQDLQMEVTVDGLRMKNNAVETYVDRTSYHAKISFDWQENEALYGLGSHEDGIMNLKGTHQYVYQQNMKACVPMIVSSKMYGILLDNYSFMTFHDDMYGSYVWMEYADQIDYYFIYGEDMRGITKAYQKLTGAVPLLPKWAFGYVQSKERYVDSDELAAIVKEFRDRQIPLDCIVLDWRSWEGDLWGEKVFDKSRFPDPHSMVEKLHEMNAKLMISIWPNMAPGGANAAEMLEHGYMLGNRSTYDAFQKKARDMYWKQADEGLFSSGLDAWWCDCTEPFEGDWKGTMKPEPEARIGVNCDEARRYLDPAYISAYSLLHSQGIYEGQRRVTNDKRVVNLTRSSYAGQHRYSTITWSGDTAASWDTLKKQIPAGLNFCVTGEPYWTTDIGAFFVKQKEQWFWAGEYEGGCDDKGYRELYVRWYQFGTFLPMFRSHGTDTPREPWRFGDKGSVFYDTLVAFADLRYKLLPYIYSLAGDVTLNGGSIMRPLGMVFSHDLNTHNIGDQYMFGPSLMVCPIVEPYFYASGSEILRRDREKDVYLPYGCEWIDFWTGERFDGGQTITCTVSLETIPLFVKAGSIIPMGTKRVMSVEDMDPGKLEIVIYPGEDAEFVLYEDSGDGYAYENGEYACTTYSWDQKTRSLHTKTEGSFTGFAENKQLNIVITD